MIITFVLAFHLDVPQSIDIPHYETPEEPSRMNDGLMESEFKVEVTESQHTE